MKSLIDGIESNFLDYFKVPDDFDPKDEERIKIFSRRMCEIRNKRNKESTAPKTSLQHYISETVVGDRKLWTQEELAKVLGKNKQMVYKYEKGIIEKIPLKDLRKICYFYDVTPHYLLGYTQKEHTVICFDEYGNLIVDESGNPKEFTEPIWFAPINVIDATKRYEKLSLDNGRLFELIDILITSSKEIQDICSLILEALLKK